MLVAEAQRIAVLGDPDVVLADVRKVQRVIEPAGVGVNARAVPRAADRLAEGDGAGRALGGAQGVGAPAADTLGVVVDAQRQAVAADQAQHHAGFLDGLGLVDGLAVEVNADAQARVDRALNVPTICRILDQRTAAIAAVAAADDGKRDAVRLDGVPVNAALELRDINATGRAVQCAVRRKGVDIALNDLLARDGLVGGRVVIIRCAVNILPAGVLVYRGGRAGHGKAVVGQLLHRNVIRPARRRVGHLGGCLRRSRCRGFRRGRRLRFGGGLRRGLGGGGCRLRGRLGRVLGGRFRRGVRRDRGLLGSRGGPAGLLLYGHRLVRAVYPRHAGVGRTQQRDGIRRAGQPGRRGRVGGVARIAHCADQVLRAVLINGQVGRLGAVGQQQMSAAAQLGCVARLAAGLGPGAVGVGHGVGDLVDDGGRARVADAGVLGTLVDLACLDDLLFNGLDVRLVGDLFFDRHGLGLGLCVALDGLDRQRVVAGGHVLGQRGAGLGIQLVIRGIALGVGQCDGCRHTQQRGLFVLGVILLRAFGRRRGRRGGRIGRGAGLGGVLDVERHTDVLLDDAGLHRQRFVRLRRGARRRGRGRCGRRLGGGRHDGRGAGLGRGERTDAGCKRAQADAGGQHHRRAARGQLIQRQPRKGAAGEIPHGVLLIKHSCSSQLKAINYYKMNHTTKKAPAASGQGWKIAQKNAEIFNIHRVCLWIIVTPRTQLSGHLVVAAAVRRQQLCWAKIPPPINRHTHRSCAPAPQETASARSAGRRGGCTPQKFSFCTVYYRRIAPCLQAGCLPTRGRA